MVPRFFLQSIYLAVILPRAAARQATGGATGRYLPLVYRNLGGGQTKMPLLSDEQVAVCPVSELRFIISEFLVKNV